MRGGGARLSIGQASRNDELQAVLLGLKALRDGDRSVRLPANWTGTAGEVARTFNAIVERDGLAAHDACDDGFSIALLDALSALKRGDASIKLALDWPGMAGQIAAAFNDVVDLNARVA